MTIIISASYPGFTQMAANTTEITCIINLKHNATLNVNTYLCMYTKEKRYIPNACCYVVKLQSQNI